MSPTPWTFYQNGEHAADGFIIESAEGKQVAHVELATDAAMICKAVNRENPS